MRPTKTHLREQCAAILGDKIPLDTLHKSTYKEEIKIGI